MKLALLNTSIVALPAAEEFCAVMLERITLHAAKLLIRDAEGLDSAIGHESTAKIMSALLDVEVPVNRQQFEHQKGQLALIFKLKGRPPEGIILTAEQIEEIGYEFMLMTRTS